MRTAQTVDTGIANMKQIGRGRLEDQDAEGGDQALGGAIALLPLTMEPTIERGKYFLPSGLDTPRFGRAEIIAYKTLDTGVTGFLAGFTAADAVGNDGSYTLGGGECTVGELYPTGVLVALFESSLAPVGTTDLNRFTQDRLSLKKSVTPVY